MSDFKARVTASTGSWYKLATPEGGEYKARIRGKFKNEGLKTTNPLAVGDWVQAEPESTSDQAVITKIYPRDNYFIRRSPKHRHKTHIIASNIDRLWIIATIASPRTSLGFIDRVLMNAAMFGIEAGIVFNKKDLYTARQLEILQQYQSIYQKYYPVLCISALDTKDVKALKQKLADKTNLLIGHSGAGKSTLLNQLLGLEIKTKTVSKHTGKGQHTTTFAEMYNLKPSGQIIDTPGIKEIGIIDTEAAEVGSYFVEFQPLLNQCKFNNCLHLKEPGCAVLNALADENIAESRYKSYLSILNEQQEKEW